MPGMGGPDDNACGRPARLRKSAEKVWKRRASIFSAFLCPLRGNGTRNSMNRAAHAARYTRYTQQNPLIRQSVTG